MPIQRKYVRDHDFVLTLLRGRVTDGDLQQHVAALTRETEGMAALIELADCTALEDVTAVSGEGIRDAARLEATRDRALHGRLAIVVPSDLVYGLARMYQAMSEPFRSEVQVFAELDEAIAWLGLAELEPTIHALREP